MVVGKVFCTGCNRFRENEHYDFQKDLCDRCAGLIPNNTAGHGLKRKYLGQVFECKCGMKFPQRKPFTKHLEKHEVMLN